MAEAEQEFRQHMVQAIGDLRTDVSGVKTAVQNIQLTLNKHELLLRRASMARGERPILSLETFRTVPCSSMLSVKEIQEHFECRGTRGEYARKDCGATAWVFFDQTHKLMRPKLVEGVLYAPGDEQPRMLNHEAPADRRGGIYPTMKSFKLLCEDRGCVWVPTSEEPPRNVHGMLHRVTVVQPSDRAHRVAVDWGIRQPPNTRLFIKNDDCV